MGHRYLLFLLAGLVLATALPCRADMSPEQRAKLWFAAHDRDHVGYLTADVVVAYELRRFKRMDSNNAGKLSFRATSSMRSAIVAGCSSRWTMTAMATSRTRNCRATIVK
jgi:hypothetical protein